MWCLDPFPLHRRRCCCQLQRCVFFPPVADNYAVGPSKWDFFKLLVWDTLLRELVLRFDDVDRSPVIETVDTTVNAQARGRQLSPGRGDGHLNAPQNSLDTP